MFQGKEKKALAAASKAEKFYKDDASEDYDPWKAPELVDNSPAWSGKRHSLKVITRQYYI